MSLYSRDLLMMSLITKINNSLTYTAPAFLDDKISHCFFHNRVRVTSFNILHAQNEWHVLPLLVDIMLVVEYKTTWLILWDTLSSF